MFEPIFHISILLPLIHYPHHSQDVPNIGALGIRWDKLSAAFVAVDKSNGCGHGRKSPDDCGIHGLHITKVKWFRLAVGCLRARIHRNKC